MMSPQKKQLLFVCTGNICRSPMAEFLLRHRLGVDSPWIVKSAGLFAVQDGAPSDEAVQALAEWNIDLRPHRSQPITRELVDQSELVVVMTHQHKRHLNMLCPDAAEKVCTIKSFGLDDPEGDVADPIGQPVETYRRARDEIDAALSDLILNLAERAPAVPPARSERKTDMKVAIGSDHGGFEHKEAVKKWLADHGIEAEDVGAFGVDSVDYPDYAALVARRVSEGTVDSGILICTTGIGMAIAANKFPRVRAALCVTPKMASLGRAHNNANILVLGGAMTSADALAPILDAWFETKFEAGGRHERRVGKILGLAPCATDPLALYDSDPEIYSAIRNETRRQRENIELIASENYVSRAVREAQGSVMTNKYAEGYPGKRWYNGCEYVDDAERLAIERAKELFGAEHANVQPHSGSGANMAVYFAMLQPGDTMLAMSLAHGGHLTHGHKVNFSGRFFNVVHYGVHPETEQIDYDEILTLAREHKPRLLCAGASAYSRIIDFKRLREIADDVGAYLMVDMAHIAGLVAAGCHPSPVPHSDFVTTTTHKTLRGPRGGMILCQARFAADIDRQIFPGVQGGPLMHAIAAKAVCFHEALQPDFKAYAEQIVRNAQTMAQELEARGLRIVSGGTDNHMMLVDLNPVDVTGKDAATVLDKVRITVNKNAIPFDKRSPFVTSGIRIGTPAVTTRGMNESEMTRIAEMIRRVLADPSDAKMQAAVREEAVDLTSRFPVP